MATRLRGGGLPLMSLESKRPIKDFDLKNLQEDEVLLSGAIILGKKKYTLEDMSCGLLVPLILPMPWNYHSGKDVLFRYEIVDKNGKILYHSGDQNMVVCMKSHFYHIGTRNQNKFPEMNQAVTKEVVELVKKSMMQ